MREKSRAAESKTHELELFKRESEAAMAEVFREKHRWREAEAELNRQLAEAGDRGRQTERQREEQVRQLQGEVATLKHELTRVNFDLKTMHSKPGCFRRKSSAHHLDDDSDSEEDCARQLFDFRDAEGGQRKSKTAVLSEQDFEQIDRLRLLPSRNRKAFHVFEEDARAASAVGSKKRSLQDTGLIFAKLQSIDRGSLGNHPLPPDAKRSVGGKTTIESVRGYFCKGSQRVHGVLGGQPAKAKLAGRRRQVVQMKPFILKQLKRSSCKRRWLFGVLIFARGTSAKLDDSMSVIHKVNQSCEVSELHDNRVLQDEIVSAMKGPSWKRSPDPVTASRATLPPKRVSETATSQSEVPTVRKLMTSNADWVERSLYAKLEASYSSLIDKIRRCLELLDCIPLQPEHKNLLLCSLVILD